MTISRTSLILSSVRGLLGAVTPCLRAVTIEFDKGPIHWRCIFDGSETEAAIELVRVAFTEVISGFPNEAIDRGIQEEYLSIPAPARIPFLAILVYLRAEESDIQAATPVVSQAERQSS